MKEFFIAYVAAIVPMAAFDYLWLANVAKEFYLKRLSHLFAADPSYGPAALFYLVYAAAIAVLVVLPSVESGGGSGKAAALGALLGLAAYAAYDLTNQATLKDWPVSVTLADLAWGVAVTAAVAAISAAAVRLFS